MSAFEAWVRFAPGNVIFPSDLSDFTGFMIAKFVVDEVTAGIRELAKDNVITLKGEMPSLSRSFRYLLRFKRDKKNEGYELLPKSGFQDAKRLPWTINLLTWALMTEIRTLTPVGDIRSQVSLIFPQASSDVNEAMLKSAPFFKELMDQSDYYRLQKIILLRRGWPGQGQIAKIRKLKTDVIEKLAAHIERAPHELCFYAHAKEYKLGEMPFAGLKDVVAEMSCSSGVPSTCGNLQMAAACFYNHLKEGRSRFGHTAFVRSDTVTRFTASQQQRDGYGQIAAGACMWLARNGHILFLDAAGEEIPSEEWFLDVRPIVDIQFPRDYRIKQRITGHLKRIHANFLASQGRFSMREPDSPLVAATGGVCNAKQRLAMDHIMDNWLTIVQGGPGSGKTFLGVKHLCAIVDWPGVLTHVGRQAVALCDLLGGSHENARTIHSAYYSMKESVIIKEYNCKKDVLILDEVYNADDWTFEKALSTCPEACRLIMVGDPDQIRPIPGEKGAGTPALDIAKAFPEHVIFLDENMRQRDDTHVIHSVVTAVRKKNPTAIDWGHDLEKHAAVLMMRPLPSAPQSAHLEVLFQLIARLRKDIGEPGSVGEHNWQLISFFNGNDPEKQGDGIIQLNQYVETYLERNGFFKGRPKYKINARLTLYPGFKLMFGAKFIPDKSLHIKGQSKGKEKVVYDEVCNGQIEVVQSVKQIKVPGTKSNCWQVRCVSRSKIPGAKGTTFLINAGLHVDAGRVYPAWAVTSNKSMGGECNNVGVYMPPGVEKSSFDRSNFYVAVSRPIHFLAVVGSHKEISAMVMRDPPVIRSGLLMYLQAAASSVRGHDWKKEDMRLSETAVLVHEALGGQEALYDQTRRKVAKIPAGARCAQPVCQQSYMSFHKEAKKARKGMTTEKVREYNAAIVKRFNARLYEGGDRPPRPTDPDYATAIATFVPVLDEQEEQHEEEEAEAADIRELFVKGRFRPREEADAPVEEAATAVALQPLHKRAKRPPLSIPVVIRAIAEEDEEEADDEEEEEDEDVTQPKPVVDEQEWDISVPMDESD